MSSILSVFHVLTPFNPLRLCEVGAIIISDFTDEGAEVKENVVNSMYKKKGSSHDNSGSFLPYQVEAKE